MEQAYDLIVIGGGPGGYEAALDAAGRGMKTALIEKNDIGGTCLNRGCIPTKIFLHAAEMLESSKKAGEYGISMTAAAVDMGALQDKKAELVETLKDGISAQLKKAKVDVYCGTGCITAPGCVVLKDSGEEEKTLSAGNILIACGSVPAIPPIPGIDLPGVMSSDGLLDLRDGVPERLVIIGGGVIGMEFATAFSSFGSHVTVIEGMQRILPGLDKELSQSMKMLMKRRGVEIHTGALVKEIRRDGERGLICVFSEKEELCEAEADAVLVSVGRKPYTEGLFGEGFELETERGRIVTDSDGRTSVPGIFAIGDVTGGIMLAHAATAEGRNAVSVILGEEPEIRSDIIPSCIYTSPEIASCGMTADEAKAAGINAVSQKYVMTANGKTVLSGGERGYIRVVAEAETGVILGAQMMCERATDMIAEFVTAISNRLTVSDMKKAVYPHPTFSEAIGELIRQI